MRTIPFLLTVLLVLVIGCAPEPTEDVAQPATTTPQTEAAAAQSDEMAVDEINQVRSAWIEAAEADDAAGVAALYADDAVFVSEMSGAVRGADALEQHWTEMFAMVSDMNVEAEKTEVSGDLAYDYGTFSQTVTPPDGEPTELTGHYIVVLKRDGGEWKIVRQLSVSPAPSASEAAE